jgi:hypothetical protein
MLQFPFQIPTHFSFHRDHVYIESLARATPNIKFLHIFLILLRFLLPTFLLLPTVFGAVFGVPSSDSLRL